MYYPGLLEEHSLILMLPQHAPNYTGVPAFYLMLDFLAHCCMQKLTHSPAYIFSLHVSLSPLLSHFTLTLLLMIKPFYNM